MTSKSFPLLTQIDEGVQLDTVDWNRNAFQTLLVCIRRSLNQGDAVFLIVRRQIYRAQRSSSMPSMSVFDD